MPPEPGDAGAAPCKPVVGPFGERSCAAPVLPEQSTPAVLPDAAQALAELLVLQQL